VTTKLVNIKNVADSDNSRVGLGGGGWKRETGKRSAKLQDWKTRKKACMESQMVYFTC